MDSSKGLDPAVERGFLKRNAIGSILVGFYFLHRPFQHSISHILGENVWFHALYITIFIAAIIYMIVNAIKTLNFGVNRQAYWFGNFRDEYLHYVNAQGNKYALSSLCASLIICFLGASYLVEMLTTFSFQDFISLNISLVGFSYGITVLALLGDES